MSLAMKPGPDGNVVVHYIFLAIVVVLFILYLIPHAKADDTIPYWCVNTEEQKIVELYCTVDGESQVDCTCPADFTKYEPLPKVSLPPISASPG